MCDECCGEQHELASPELIARTREIEAAMPGERVPEAAWAIFFSHGGGSLAFEHHRRMMASCAAAAEALDAHSHDHHSHQHDMALA